MKILIACEESATTREAFKTLGHDAWSCDLKPSKIPGQHIQGDVFNIFDQSWDLIILHPPCTYTALCGNGSYHDSPLRLEGAELCKRMWEEANKYCLRVVLEQPKTIMQRFIGKKSQVIHPWQFGHGETKETWLWIRGLPLLQPTNTVDGRENRIWKMAPTKDPEERREKRSKTYTGIAKAMAEQWGNL